jgi:hypothetical protein
VTLRLRQWEAAPDFRLWTTYIQVHGDEREERIAILRLPSWQMRESICSLREEWHQLALVYRGWHGFSFHWIRPFHSSGGAA